MTISSADWLAIHELLGWHGHLIDAGELDRLTEVFTEDVVYDVSDFGFGALHGVPARSKGIGVLADGTTGSAVYEDELRREPAGWRIARRTVLARARPLGG